MINGLLRIGVLVLVGLCVFAGPSMASEDLEAEDGGMSCRDASVMERTFTDICWTCIMPMRIGGDAMGSMGAPSGANDSYLCSCDDGRIGTNIGMWFPVRLSEVVKTEGCSPTLGGSDLGISSQPMASKVSSEASPNTDGGTFRHVHWFTFPVGEMMGLIAGCNITDSLDLTSISEFSPTWDDDEMSALTNPETAVLANPVSVSACIAEASTTGIFGTEPIESLFWCAGSWGTIYPVTGNLTNDTSSVDDTALMTVRKLANLHRWGMARKVMGNSCGGSIHPMLPKNQYKLSQFHPKPSKNDFHWFGESLYRMGAHRTKVNDDNHIHLIYRWNDCCFEI